MASKNVNSVLEAENNAKVSVSNATAQKAQNIENAKSAANAEYEESIKKVDSEISEMLEKAEENAKEVVSSGNSIALEKAAKLISDCEQKKETAINSVIEMLKK